MYKYTTIIGIAVILILLFILRNANKSNTELTNVVSAVNEKMVQYRDKYGKEVTKREIIQTSRVNDFVNYKTNDSLLMELQQQVKSFKKQLKNNGSSTIYEGETKVDKSTVTNVYYIDSNYVYKSNFSDKWITYDIVSSKDSTKLDLKVENKYNVVIGEERVSLFKRKPFATVTNYNPYSKIKDLRTYQVKTKNRKWGLGGNVSYGVSSDLQPRLYLGVGLNYNLIKL